MSDWGDLLKGGGTVGLVSLLLALRYYIPKWNSKPVVSQSEINRVIENAVEQRLRDELRNQKTIREISAEARDDRMLECLTRMEQFQKQAAKDTMELLHNIRDIARDVATSRGLQVRYFDKDK